MSDFLPLNGTDHIEIYVGNAKQSAHYFKTAFGFQDLAYAGLETGLKDRTSYVLKQDKIILVLTSPLTSTSPINDHLVKHGDGVKNCALWVDDATKSWHETTSRGAVSAFEPYTLTDEQPTAIPYTFLWSAKTTEVPSCRALCRSSGRFSPRTAD